jgi:hypothetical protein
MVERRCEDHVAVATTARGSRQIDDERRADDACDAAREQAVRRLRDRVRAQRFRDTGGFALDDVARRLGRDVARRDPRASRRQDELRLGGERPERSRDLLALVRDRAPYDVEPVRLEQLLEQVAAPVVARSGDRRVGNRQDGRPQFVFSSSRTSPITISLSIALAMS